MASTPPNNDELDNPGEGAQESIQLRFKFWKNKKRKFSGFRTVVVPAQNVSVGQVKDVMLQDEFLQKEYENSQQILERTRLHLFMDHWNRKELRPDHSSLVEKHGYRHPKDDHASTNLSERQRNFKGCFYLIVDYLLEIQVVERPLSNQDKRRREMIQNSGTPLRIATEPKHPTVKIGDILKIPILLAHSTVTQIKKKIVKRTSIQIERLHLIHGDQDFWRDEPLPMGLANRLCRSIENDHHTEDESEPLLQLWICPWLVRIRTLQGLFFHVGVDPLEILPNLRTLLCRKRERLKISAPDQILLVREDGVVLGEQAPNTTVPEDEESSSREIPVGHQSLQSRGVTNGCTLHLALRQYSIPPSQIMDRGCQIPRAEHRGITLVQLREVATTILVQCHQQKWTRQCPSGTQLLRPEDVTLYDLMHNYVRPITRQRKCSYVEFVSTDEKQQIPIYFCSHWWGESVLQFLACLEQHAFDRNISETTPYWVCGYALNQHDISGELTVGKDPKNSPFYRAMKLTQGTVSVLDSQATCYSRVWCAYEISIVMNDMKAQNEIDDTSQIPDKRYFYDVYALSKDANGNPYLPVGLTEGTVACDMYARAPDGYLNQKSRISTLKWNDLRRRRQASFPLEICHKALAISLEQAEATVAGDKKMILHSITGNDSELSHEPPKSHAAYDQLNCALRGKFAESAYRMALESGSEDLLHDFRLALSAAPYNRLVISFENCNEFKNEAQFFTKAIPRCLEYLELDISGVWLKALDNPFAEGIGQLHKLKFLKLKASFCKSLKHACGLWLHLAKLRLLESLHIDFSNCGRLSSLHGLHEALPNLQQLSSLSVRMGQCHALSSVALFSEGLAKVAGNLQTCHLDFSCHGLKSLDDLGNAFGKMTDVQELSLHTKDCTIDSIANLAHGLKQAGSLSSLHLHLNASKRLASIEDIEATLLNKPCLHFLYLSFIDCPRISSIQGLVKGLKATFALRTLHLTFKDCKNLKSIDGLGEAIGQLGGLEKACLHFKGCDHLQSIDSLFNAFDSGSFPCLERLWLDFAAASALVLPPLKMVSHDGMPRLKSLRLRFPFCRSMASVASLVEAFKSVSSQQNEFDWLELDFEETSDPDDKAVVKLFQEIAGIHAEKLDLRFSGFPRIRARGQLVEEISKHNGSS